MFTQSMYSTSHRFHTNIHVLCICIHRGVEILSQLLDLFSPLLSCSPYSLYTAQFQFIEKLIDLSDNVLHAWLFPHHCLYIHVHVYSVFYHLSLHYIINPYCYYNYHMFHLPSVYLTC